MNEAGLTAVASKLRKAYRSAFFCGVLVIMVMIVIVTFALLTEQPIDQKALAEDWTPLVILMAGVAGVCHMLHGFVVAELKARKKCGK